MNGKLDSPETMAALQAKYADNIPTTSKDLTPEQARTLVSKAARETIVERNLADPTDRGAFESAQEALVEAFVERYMGLGIVSQLMNTPNISEIMINGVDEIWVEREGELRFLDGLRFDSEDQLRSIQQKIAAAANRRIDESSPLCDARLPDGSRVNMTLPPVSLDGPTITIRRFPDEAITIEQLVQWESLTAEVAEFLRLCVEARCNILVVGGTGAGKTTMLNALGNFIRSGDRITTVEDAAELNLQADHVVRLESRPANLEGEGAISIGQLVKNTLRMRPDRVIIGECRSGEALDMLQAMNTGHDGSLSTLHANSPKDSIPRLMTLAMMNRDASALSENAIKRQIASAIDLIVYCGRAHGIGGKSKRMVTKVTEVGGIESDQVTMNDLFEHRIINNEHRLVATGSRPAFEGTRFVEHNLGRIPDEIFGGVSERTALEQKIGGGFNG